MEESKPSISRLSAMKMIFPRSEQRKLDGLEPKQLWKRMREYMRSSRNLWSMGGWHPVVATEKFIYWETPIFSSVSEGEQWEIMMRQLVEYPLCWVNKYNVESRYRYKGKSRIRRPASTTVTSDAGDEDDEEAVARYISYRLFKIREEMMESIDYLDSGKLGVFMVNHWMKEWEENGSCGSFDFAYVDQIIISIVKDIDHAISRFHDKPKEQLLEAIWASWKTCLFLKQEESKITPNSVLKHLETSKEMVRSINIERFILETMQNLKQVRSAYGMSEAGSLDCIIANLERMFTPIVAKLKIMAEYKKRGELWLIYKYLIEKIEACLK